MAEKIYNTLIVDDDKTHLLLLEKTLTKLTIPEINLIVRKAMSYDQAVDSIKDDYPDLVILDIVLIGLSGLYIAAYITAYAINHDLPKPKIIFNSGGFENKEKIVRKAELLGATFLWKPLDLNILQEIVKKAIIEKFPPKSAEKELSKEEVNDIPKTMNQRFTKENIKLFKDLEHYVAHLIMELQFFRTKSKDLAFGSEEEKFLDEMFEIESKTIETFEQIKKEFLT